MRLGSRFDDLYEAAQRNVIRAREAQLADLQSAVGYQGRVRYLHEAGSSTFNHATGEIIIRQHAFYEPGRLKSVFLHEVGHSELPVWATEFMVDQRAASIAERIFGHSDDIILPFTDYWNEIAMKELALPNEVMLDSSEKALLKKCINTLCAGALSNELAEKTWTVTRAEFCETEAFLGEMQFFGRQHPFEFKQLCETVGERARLGIFQFQLARTSDMANLPKHFVGRSLLVVTDANDIELIWRFTSLVST